MTGSGLSSAVQFISMCLIGFRSGLCADQSSYSTTQNNYLSSQNCTGIEKPVNLKVSTLAIQCMRQNVFDYCFSSLGCKAVATIPCSEGFCHATLLLVGKSSLLVDKLKYHATENVFHFNYYLFNYPL